MEDKINDELRTEMARVLGFVTRKTSYGDTTESVRDMTWQEIFFEIGRLAQKATNGVAREEIHALDSRINDALTNVFPPGE